MNFKAKFLTLLCLFIFPAILTAQVIDTISYVPVKHGYYDQVVTKTSTKLATSTGVATIDNLKANSSTLNIATGQVNFGKPVHVGFNTLAEAGVTLKATTALTVGGSVETGGTITATKAPNTSRIKAKNVYLPNKTLKLTAPLMVEGVAINNPDVCPIDASKGKLGAKWMKLDGWDADMNYAEFVVYGCSGTNTKECRATAADQKACTDASGNSWNDIKCCCDGSKLVYFPTGSAARMCENTQMCTGESLVNQYLACSGNYSATSPQCICAKGTLADCIKAIYGSGSTEYACLSNSTLNSKWPCTCPGYRRLVDGTNNYYRNYACLNNPPKTSCELTCNFPEYKEYYNNTYKCCCLDNGYYSGSTYRCDYSTPLCQPQNQLKRCCCAPNHYGGGYGYNNIVGRAQNYDTCGQGYYGGGYYPGDYYSSCYCEYGYYNVPDSWGGSSYQYFQPDLCTCDGNYYW